MSTLVFLAVLGSALMHASWNGLVKARGDRFAAIIAMSVGLGVLSAPFLFFVDMPKGQTWFWLFCSMALHTGYRTFLGLAYDGGDMAQAYPLARGTAPLLTTIAGAMLIAEIPGPWVMAGVALLTSGALILALRGAASGDLHGRTVTFALITAVFIAGYSISDGSGARSAANALSYAAWLYTLDGIWCFVLINLLRGPAQAVSAMRDGRSFFAAAFLSGGAYLVAMWAMTKAPIGAVAALRESSILFAIGISVLFLGEALSARRVAAAVLMVAGIAALKLA